MNVQVADGRDSMLVRPRDARDIITRSLVAVDCCGVAIRGELNGVAIGLDFDCRGSVSEILGLLAAAHVERADLERDVVARPNAACWIIIRMNGRYGPLWMLTVHDNHDGEIVSDVS